MILTLNLFGSLFTFLFGLWAFFQPKTVANVLALIPKGKRGISEIRATYGGVLLSFGGYALWNQSSESFQILGLSYVLAAICRSASLIFDKVSFSKSLKTIFAEIIIAVCLLV